MTRAPGFVSAAAASMVAAAVAVGLLLAGQPTLLALGLAAIAGAVVSFPWWRAAKPSVEPSQKLEARERLMCSVMDASSVAMLLYAEDSGRIVYANRGAKELFFEGSICEGKNFLRLVADAPPALGSALLARDDRLVRIDVEGLTETYHVSRRSFELDGEELSLLMVRQLTSELARREVEVLKKVIRVISHELNNSLAPIRSLVGSARLMADRPEHKDKLGRAFDTIEERATHLGTFVESYARLARLPAPKPSETAWQPLLTRLAELYPAARIDANSERGWFDEAQIEQVLINLLKNAAEAGGPPEDVVLDVRVDEHGSTIEALDRGRGLSEEALESAFLPFYSTKDCGGGLGLALSREIVQAHGGHIALKNRTDGGTVATIWLPARNKPRDRDLSRSRLTLSRQ